PRPKTPSTAIPRTSLSNLRTPAGALSCAAGGNEVNTAIRACAELRGARRRMVERLASSGVRDVRVLAALEAVPRHWLVPEALHAQAYRDAALPIGDGQTISAPSTVARMSEALALTGRESVLEIGTGSAYQASVLALLADRVVSIERLPRLAA